MAAVMSWAVGLLQRLNNPTGYAACAVIAALYLWRQRRIHKYDRQHFVPLVADKDYTVVGKVVSPPLESFDTLVEEMRHSFMRGNSRSLKVRKANLMAMRQMLQTHEDEFLAALKADLGRVRFEGIMYDIEVTMGELNHLIKNLAKLNRPTSTHFDLLTFPSEDNIYAEPYGLSLVIGTWNYPIMLTLVPVAGAIAAGNTVILKPSNVSPNVANLLARLIPKYLDPKIVAVAGPGIKGDRASIQKLLANRFDKIFFTGGPTVGRMVMKAAAEHLTSVTLELGGKNPVFVDSTADVALAAKRTVWGRMMNAGQQCIAPDYVLVHKAVAPAFLEACKKVIADFYQGDAKDAIGRIVNDRHFQRLQTTVLTNHGGEIICGGNSIPEERYIEPTVLSLPLDSPAMDDETFGPVLMVTTVDSMDDAIRYVAGREKSLSLYIFSNSKAMQERIIQNTSAGGVTVNGTLFHVGHSGMPFGGVGLSGIGAYHGKHTFASFCHYKPVLRKLWLPDGGALSDPFFLYPPWTGLKERVIRMLMRLA